MLSKSNIPLQGAQFGSSSQNQSELRRADSLRAVVQLKGILSEVMSMSNQDDISDNDHDIPLGYETERVGLEGEVKVIHVAFLRKNMLNLYRW